MKVHVQFFAVFHDLFKKGEETIELCTPLTVREIFLNLFEDRAAGERLLASTRFAINYEYVPEDTCVKDNDEVAVIPPMSGG